MLASANKKETPIMSIPTSTLAVLAKRLGISRGLFVSRADHLGIEPTYGKNKTPRYTEADFERVEQLEQQIKHEKLYGLRKLVIMEKLGISASAFEIIIKQLGFKPRKHVEFCPPSFTSQEFDAIKKHLADKQQEKEKYRTINQMSLNTGHSWSILLSATKELEIKPAFKNNKKEWVYLQENEARLDEYIKANKLLLENLICLTTASKNLAITEKTARKLLSNLKIGLSTNPLKKHNLFITTDQFATLKEKVAQIREKDQQALGCYKGYIDSRSPAYNDALTQLKNGTLAPTLLAIRNKFPVLTTYKIGVLLREADRIKLADKHAKAKKESL